MVHFELTVDLLHIVLSKLPVKSLFRLRCVSKVWLNIIDSSYFINLHLTQTAKTCSNTIIVPYDFKDEEKSMPMYAFEFDNHIKARKIEPPVVGYDKSFVHACNGLISLSTEGSFVIWNPATNKHRVVDKYKVIVEDKEERSPYYGFGYDEKTDDYKVVMFVKKLKDVIIDYRKVLFGKKVKKEEKCYIYSLKTGSWREAGTPVHEIMGSLIGSVYANGAIYWVDTYLAPNVGRRIVALDLTTEKWLPLTKPPKPSKWPPLMESWSLSSHHGSLCLSCRDYETGMFDLWVLNYYQGTKNNNTWNKLLTIKGSLLCKIIPLWSLNKTSRHQVLIHDDYSNLQMYDIEERTRKSFDVYDIFGGSGDSGIWHFVTGYETLVSV